MKKIVIIFSGLIIFAIVLSLLAMPKPTLAQVPVIEVEVDIKPGSCPNPINLKKKGVTPVAIVGSTDFDPVATIDVNTIMLEGVPAVKSEMSDSTQPNISNPDADLCYDCFDAEANFNCFWDSNQSIWSRDCGEEEPFCTDYCGDMIMDLIVYFSTSDLADVIDETGCITLTLTGETFDGVPFIGTDMVRIK